MHPCQWWLGPRVTDKLHPSCCLLAQEEDDFFGIRSFPEESILHTIQQVSIVQLASSRLTRTKTQHFQETLFTLILDWFAIELNTINILWGTVTSRQKLIIILSALRVREDGAMGAKGLIVEESGNTHSITCSMFVNHLIFEEIQSGLGGPSLVISQAQIRHPKQWVSFTLQLVQTPHANLWM